MERYVIIANRTAEVLFRTNTKDSLTRYIQKHAAEDVAVYQRRYVSESLLCDIQYEDELHLTSDHDEMKATGPKESN